MSEDLLKKFVDGSIDEVFFGAELYHLGTKVIQGIGRVYFKDNQLQASIYGEADVHLPENEYRRLRSDDYKLTGRLALGWYISIEGHSSTLDNFFFPAIEREIILYPDRVTVEMDLPERAQSSGVSVLIYMPLISEFIWSDITEIERKRNGRSGKSISRDCLLGEFDGVKFELVKGDDKYSSLTISDSSSDSLDRVNASADAFVNALSIRLGRFIEPMCKWEWTDSKSRLLFMPNSKRDSRLGLLPPFRDASESEINFLRLSTAFLMEEKNKPLIWYWRLLWDVRDNVWDVHSTMAAISVELLSSFIIHRAEVGGSNEGMRKAIAKAGKHLGVSISDEETKLWLLLRNSSVHWRSSSDKIDRAKAFMCCVTILYKLTAGLIGWKGSLIDFTCSKRSNLPYPFITPSENLKVENDSPVSPAKRRVRGARAMK